MFWRVRRLGSYLIGNASIHSRWRTHAGRQRRSPDRSYGYLIPHTVREVISNDGQPNIRIKSTLPLCTAGESVACQSRPIFTLHLSLGYIRSTSTSCKLSRTLFYQVSALAKNPKSSSLPGLLILNCLAISRTSSTAPSTCWPVAPRFLHP